MDSLGSQSGLREKTIVSGYLTWITEDEKNKGTSFTILYISPR